MAKPKVADSLLTFLQLLQSHRRGEIPVEADAAEETGLPWIAGRRAA